jgi:hypothetical protein
MHTHYQHQIGAYDRGYSNSNHLSKIIIFIYSDLIQMENFLVLIYTYLMGKPIDKKWY